MDALIFLEEMGRNGDVLRRIPLDHLPIRIGRGYDMDVILDDPYVAASHLEIRRADDGGLCAVDLGSKNGTHMRGTRPQSGVLRITDDDVVHVGRTRLRFRMAGHSVPPDLPLRRVNLDRQPVVFKSSAAVFVILLIWHFYITEYDTHPHGNISAPLLLSSLVLAWAGVWSLVSRILSGYGNFYAHGIVAFLGAVTLFLCVTLWDYVDFAFDHPMHDWIRSVAVFGLMCCIVYRHLRLYSRARPRRLAIASILLVGVLILTFKNVVLPQDAKGQGRQEYSYVIEPSKYLWTDGDTPERFFDDAGKLRRKLH